MNGRMCSHVPLLHTAVGLMICCLPGCSHEPPRQAAERVEFVALDYQFFDQSPGNGWRQLADAGRFLEAADAINGYLEARHDLEPWQIVNLRFHAGQCYAFADQTDLALDRFRSAFQTNEPADSPIRWNAYVRATIAFLLGNRDELVACREEIARGPRLQGEIPNLDVADRLLTNFGRSYREAYGVK